MGDKPIINVSGCPPIPEVVTGTLLQFITTGQVPDLDEHRRPKAFFGNTIHDRCYRRSFYDQGKFAKSFDDEGARNGWCLYELGCKGPTTYNACATLKWNGGTSFPIESGHGCLGCSEPGFWDKGSFYSALSAAAWGKAGEVRPLEVLEFGAAAAAAGAVLGARGGRHKPPTPAPQRTTGRQRTERRLVMDLLGFARGPALKAALAVFILGVVWRIVGFALLRIRPRSETSRAPRSSNS